MASEHRAHPTKYKVRVSQRGASSPMRTWGPFDSRQSASDFIEDKRNEARRMGWGDLRFDLVEPTENWGASGPLRRDRRRSRGPLSAMRDFARDVARAVLPRRRRRSSRRRRY
jgi:hypothetical protein